MMKRTVLASLALSSILFAPLTEAAEKKKEKPDYSRTKLLQIFSKPPEEEVDRSKAGVVGRVGNVNVRWVPFVAPLQLNDGTYGTNSVMPVVDPFTLLGTEMAFSSEHPFTLPGPDLAWGEKRYRRGMLRAVRAANRRDSGK